MIKNGEIFVKQAAHVIQHESFGYRDLPNQIKNNPSTKYPTASAGKVFVATAILKLVEDQKLTLDTKIKSIMDYDLGHIDGDTTIQALLTHTSNVPDYFDEETMSDYAALWQDFPNYKIRHSSALLELFVHKKPIDHQNQFRYNNAGFVLLGLIIEQVTKMPFDVYLKTVIFDKAKMHHTGYFELDRLPENTANAYIYDEQTKSYHTNIYSVDVKGTGAGGAFTNALDISRFWTALLSGKLIGKTWVNEMLKPHIKKDNYGYGLGIWLDKDNHPYFVGEDPGVTFITSYNLNTQRQITLISNTGDNVFKHYQKLKHKH